MRAVVIKAPSDVSVDCIEDPKPAADEVLVKVSLTGVCGTDLHILDGHFRTARYPVVPGHEMTGVVVATGADVTSPGPGDRVAIDPGMPCRTCPSCREGRPNLCERRNALGITRPGGAAELVAVPAVNCHVLDDNLEDAAAILCEPLACVLHAFDLVPTPASRRALVFGAGTIGILATQAALHLGAHCVEVVDTNAGRLPTALRAGARAAETNAHLLGTDAAWDLVIDATGASPAIVDGLSRVQRGGTFLQIGVAPEDAVVPLSPYQLFAREITIVGSMTTRHTFPRALRLLATDAIDTAPIVEEPMPLSRYAEAVARVRSGGSLKVVLRPDA